MMGMGSSKLVVLCAFFCLATPTAATAFAPAPLDGWVSYTSQAAPSLRHFVQYGGEGGAETERSRSEGAGTVRAGRRAALRSLRRVEQASRNLRRNLKRCDTTAGNSDSKQSCVSRVVNKWTGSVTSRRVELQRKPAVNRGVREAAAAIQSRPSPRAAARVVSQKAQEVRATIALITLADDALVDSQTRAVETIASDLDVIAATLIEIQGVWLIVPGRIAGIEVV